MTTTPNTGSTANGGDDWLQTRPGERCAIRISASETNGAYSIVEIVSQPGDGTMMHVHQNEDEHFVVVEGIARIAIGDRTFDATSGTAVTLPRRIPHAWANPSDTSLRMVVTCTPGGVEEALQWIASGRDLEKIRDRFGVDVVGAPLIPSS